MANNLPVPTNNALNSINVKRILTTIEDDIEQYLYSFLFQPNDAYTRGTIQQHVDQYMFGLKQQRAIKDYQVICDSSNNTPSTVNNGELFVNLYVQPTMVVPMQAIQIKLGGAISVNESPLYDYPYCDEY